MKEFFKKNWKLISIISAAVVAAVVIIVLCVCLIPSGKKKLSTPKNVQVTQTSLTWDAVENAEKGYTIKINGDETTTSDTNSLNLSTVTAKLTEGENTLYVKANATDKFEASDYSKEVKYTYTPAQPPEKTALSTPANLKIEDNKLKWDAVTGATGGYTVKINDDETTTVNTNELDLSTVTAKLTDGENKLSVKANATDSNKESAYSAEISHTPKAPERQKFAAPANLKVEGTELTWDEVTGATNGYTVRIGGETSTKIIPVTSGNKLDLSAKAVTDLLVRGNNSIAVKVNGTDDKDESAYSGDYIYEYVIAAADEADAFKTAVNEIGTVALNSQSKIQAAKDKYKALSDEAKAIDGVGDAITTLATKDAQYYTVLVAQVKEVTEASTKTEIETAEAAVATATAYYATLIDNTLPAVAGAKAALEANSEKLTALKADIEKQITDYKQALEAAEAAADAEAEGASVTALQRKMTEANTAKAAVCAAAQSVEAEKYEAYNTRLATVQTTLTAWTEELTTATEALAYTFATLEGEEADENAEANYAKAVELLAAYEALPAYVKAGLTARYTAINDAKDDADEHLQGVVEGVADKVSELDETKKVSVGYYEDLKGLKKEIEALGTRATELWNAEDNAENIGKVESEMTRVETTPVANNYSTFITGMQSGKVILIYEDYNVLDKTVAYTTSTAPVAIITINGVAAAVTTEVKNGTCIYTTSWTAAAWQNSTEGEVDTQADEGESKIGKLLTLAYEVGSVKKTEAYDGVEIWNKPEGSEDLVFNGYKFDDASLYFGNAALVDGVLKFTGSPAYADIYLSSDITVTSNEVYVSGLPILKGMPVTDGMFVDSIRYYIATNCSELINNSDDMDVYFVIYKLEDGARTTMIDKARVSDTAYTLALTEEDKKDRLFFGAVGGVFEVWGPGTDPGRINFSASRINMTELKTQFFGTTEDISDAQVYAELRYEVEVTLDGEAKTFFVNCSDMGISSAVLKLNIYNLFKNDEASTYSIRARLALREGSEYSDRLKESAYTDQVDWNFTATEADTKIALNLSGTKNANGRWELIGVENNNDDPVPTRINYDWAAVNTNKDLHDGIVIKVYDTEGIDDIQTYDFLANETPFAVYERLNDGFINWSEIDGAIYRDWAKKSEADKQKSHTFVFIMQTLPNEAGKAIGYSASDGVYATKVEDGNIVRDTRTYTKDWTVPDGNQLRFSGAYFEFLRDNQPATTVAGNNDPDGSIFEELYGVTMIEVHFSKGEETYSAYLIIDDTDAENFDQIKLVMYKEVTIVDGVAVGVGKALGCDMIRNGYREMSLFEDWVKECYEEELKENGSVNPSNNDEVVFSANGWSFSTKIHHNGTYFIGESEFSTPITYNA